MGRLKLRRRRVAVAALGLFGVLVVAAFSLAWRGLSVAAVISQVAAMGVLVLTATLLDAP